MKCPYCGYEVGKESICPHCKAEIPVKKKPKEPVKADSKSKNKE